jgi:hypothetical protein
MPVSVISYQLSVISEQGVRCRVWGIGRLVVGSWSFSPLSPPSPLSPLSPPSPLSPLSPLSPPSPLSPTPDLRLFSSASYRNVFANHLQ